MEQKTEEIEFVCFMCEEKTPIDDKDKDDKGNPICSDCFSDNYCICDDCSKVLESDDATSVCDGDYLVCSACYDRNYFCCDDCGNYLHNDSYAENGYCDDCIDNHRDSDGDNDGYHRHYSNGNEYVTRGKRAYSCEIECYYPDADVADSVYNKLPAGVGVSDDGSLDDRGKEFQTPKLSGRKGDKVLKQLTTLLVDNDFSVNKSCGLHIHIDTGDIANDFKKIKKIILFYLAFEPVIYSYLPYSRRKNTYCLPLARFYHEEEILNAYTIEDLEKIWYRENDPEKVKYRKGNGHDQTRYAGVNLHSLLSNGHIELRHHSGTIDYEKIRNWIELHKTIIDTIAKDTISIEALSDIKYILTLEGKEKEMFNMLGLTAKLKKYLTARAKKFGNVVTEETKCAE